MKSSRRLGFFLLFGAQSWGQKINTMKVKKENHIYKSFLSSRINGDTAASHFLLLSVLATGS